MKNNCHSCPNRKGRKCGKYNEMINLIGVEDVVLEFNPAKECENDNRRNDQKRA